MVEIPDDVAKREAERLRWLAGQEEQRCGGKGTGESQGLYAIADLLTPSAPTLREQVMAAPGEYLTEDEADAVLAVVADWLNAQPMTDHTTGAFSTDFAELQRRHDVRLLRGAS